LRLSVLFCNDKVEVIIAVSSDIFDNSVVAQVVGIRNGIDGIVSVFVKSNLVLFKDTELFLVLTSDTIVISSDIKDLFWSSDVEKWLLKIIGLFVSLFLQMFVDL
jgi:hypothetical protein